MAEPLLRALATAPRRRARRRAPRPRRSPPAGAAASPSRAGAASSCGTSTSRPAAASRSRRTTTPRRTSPTTRTPRERPRRAARRAVRQLARRDHHRTPTSSASPRRARRCCTRRARPSRSQPQRATTRPRTGCSPEDHPVLRALGHLRPAGPDQAVAPGEVPPGRGVPARALGRHRRRAAQRAGCATPTDEEPLRVVDLGCGNAYLTFAAHAWLRERMPVRLVGVDVKEQSRRHNTEVAERLGVADELTFLAAGIGDVVLERAAGRRTRPARVRHRHRRRPAAGGRLGGRAGPRGPVLPSRHLRTAAPSRRRRWATTA